MGKKIAAVLARFWPKRNDSRQSLSRLPRLIVKKDGCRKDTNHDLSGSHLSLNIRGPARAASTTRRVPAKLRSYAAPTAAGAPGFKAVSAPATAPLFGLSRKLSPLLAVTRMRSTVGLKSKPKSVSAPPTPADCGSAIAPPIWLATPVAVSIT
jgi:hypothetical protein